ncbi:hypothetical protein [Agrococcus sp. HG114]|uniref:hypothetical protein n=1 Tax=Agrococcus sp. HG114 TaxID=2969757 RepID=UPI00215AFDB7|nr:hypothetical protein [Agrococcus sp. HG114]MCR8670040.1 hypothetical protein [Agrococcus sp. HG114]
MRYRWDEGVITADGDEVARTGPGFGGLRPAFRMGEGEWAFRVDTEGLIGALDGRDRLGVERGRIWQSTWRMAGLRGPLELTRTTSWLLGRLYFDLARGGERIAEVVPEGPWQYRPALEVSGELPLEEAVFVLWAAARIDARRPAHVVRPSLPGGSSGGGVTVG